MNLKRIISKIITVFSILLMAGAVAILITLVMTSRDAVPSVGGYSVMRVVTGSMEPEIPTNSLVLVERMDGKEDPEGVKTQITAGDVITFYSADPSLQGMVISHRVVRTEEQNGSFCYITKGDANTAEDGYPVSLSSVLGKVVWCSASLGTIVSLMQNPLFFFPVIIVPLLILIFLNLRTSVRDIKKATSYDKEEAIREAIEAAKAKKEKKQNEE